MKCINPHALDSYTRKAFAEQTESPSRIPPMNPRIDGQHLGLGRLLSGPLPSKAGLLGLAVEGLVHECLLRGLKVALRLSSVNRSRKLRFAVSLKL